MKIFFKSILFLIVLTVTLALILVFWVDINRFKPIIQHAASEQGIALEIGEMGWSLWPVVGLRLSDVSVAAKVSPEKAIAELHQASLSAALLPLLQGKLKVDSLFVEGAAIHLISDDQGRGNWEALTAENAPANAPADVGANRVGKLEINRIRIRDSALNYEDIKNDQQLRISQLHLDMDDVNTAGAPFSMALSGIFSIVQSATADKLEVAAKLSQQITLDNGFNNMQVDKGNIQLEWVANPSANINLDYSLAVSDLQKNLAYQGQIELQPLNLRHWLAALGIELETANGEALKLFSLNSRIKGDNKQVSLEPLSLTLDKTHLNGNLAITDFSTTALAFKLQADAINLDDYLPPANNVSETVAAPAESTPLPLDALRGLAVDGKINLSRVTVKNIVLESMEADIQAREGIIEQTFSTRLYQGNAVLNSKMDVRARAENTNDAAVDDLVYESAIELKSLNLRQLLGDLGVKLETANSDTLKQFSLSTHAKGDSKQVSFEPLAITLDKTRFTGAVAVTDIANAVLNVTLQGNRINVDDYLPPVSDVPAETTAASAAEDTPLPLGALRGLTLDARLNMNQMTMKKMSLENMELWVNAKKGIVEQKLGARAYQGDIRFNSQLDARPEKARLDFDGNVKGIELAPLLKDMQLDNKKWDLSGAIQLNTKGTSQGASVNQLIDAMDSTANFSGAQVRMSPLNIEEQFCKLVNLVTQNNPEEVAWDSFTEMRQLNGNLVWKEQVIQLQSLNAGVAQLLLASTGKINLATDKYEFKLPIKLAETSKLANLKGCSISSPNYWVDRGLSLLRCKGSFAAINPVKDCGFDKSALGDLTKDYAEYKLREKHGAKIDAAEQKLKDKRQDLLNRANEKLGGEGTVTKPKDLLNNFLKKKLGGDASSSASASSVASQQ